MREETSKKELHVASHESVSYVILLLLSIQILMATGYEKEINNPMRIRMGS
jgi:hypothetical protein